MFNYKFTIRVYGILIDEKNTVLITDEIFGGKKLTKFPGGGLEYGEGTIDCLKRECLEEMGQEIEVLDHFYTQDFFQPSVFNQDFQVLCIYYLIKTKEELKVDIKQKRFDFPEEKDSVVVFRSVPLNKIVQEDFTFENDRRVAKMIYDNR